VDMLGRDLAERKLASSPSVGEDDIERAAFCLHRGIQPIKVRLVRDRALYCAGVRAKLGDSSVERLLPATIDVDEGALLDEAFCGSAADARSAAGDHGGLSIQSGHVMHPSF